MYRRKALVAIADGLGDRPIGRLGGLTPLQKARTPTLDFLAQRGICGMMDLLAPGIPVGTDMGHLLLFGGSAEEYPGRGPVEACGIAMNVEEGDVLFRCNFATVDEKGIVVDRRAGRISSETDILGDHISGMELGKGCTAYFKPSTGHRGVLILRGPGLCSNVTDSDPKTAHESIQTVRALDDSFEASRTATMLNAFLQASAARLAAHPVNIRRQKQGLLPANSILTRGGGQFRAMAQIPQVHGFRGCCIAGESTVLGMARLTGYTALSDPSFTADLATKYELKAAMALQALKDNDLVFVHLKATDLAGHDNLPDEKVMAIELFDAMVGQLHKNLPPETCLALAADHSTPCEVGEHTGEPVPVVIYGEGVRTDTVAGFDEIACAQGGLGRINGTGFITGIFDYMGYSKKRGS